MIQKIVGVKNPALRNISKPVQKFDKRIKKLIHNLEETLESQKKPIGVGLAAPQIGKNIRMFAAKPHDKTSIFVNPEIVSISKKPKMLHDEKTKLMEGCLSLPNLYGPLKRPDSLKLNFLDKNGDKKTILFEGFEAQIIQHEIDHLDGVLFTDKLLEQHAPLYELKNGEWEKVDI